MGRGIPMSNRNLSVPLFHGTTSDLKPGDVIGPTDQVISGKREAYATNEYYEAHTYARSRARNRGALFGSVYEVEPLENDETLKKSTSITGDQRKKPIRVSEKGFRVKRHVGFADLGYTGSRATQ
jgi:hypothetical protein